MYPSPFQGLLVRFAHRQTQTDDLEEQGQLVTQILVLNKENLKLKKEVERLSAKDDGFILPKDQEQDEVSRLRAENKEMLLLMAKYEGSARTNVGVW